MKDERRGIEDLVVETFVAGSLSTNCYLVFDKSKKKGFVVDAPGGIDELLGYIRAEKLEILFCLITHCHYDHIAGLEAFSDRFYVHSQDIPFLTDTNLNFSSFLGEAVTIKPPAILLDESLTVNFDGRNIEVIHTPGHTPGSVSFRLGQWLFSGDTLFCRSIGRTDIPLASSQQIIKSIKDKLMKLPDDTIVYPGHGQTTTIGEERVNNPFLW